MKYLSDNLFTGDYSFYTVSLFIGIGFLAGFFLKQSFQSGKGKFEKLEKEAKLNQARIASLKEKIENLEKEQDVSGGPGVKK